MGSLEPKTVQALGLFVEKAHKLRSLRFTQHMLERGGKLKLSQEAGEPMMIEWEAPDPESVDAFVLTMRFFIQNNERSSLGSLERIAADPGLSMDWQAQYARVRAEFNNYLNMEAGPMQIMWGGHTYTHGEIMDTFVFGALAHANREKQELFEQWKQDKGIFVLFQYYFTHTLMTLLNAVAYLTSLAEKELGVSPAVAGSAPPIAELPAS